MGYRRQGSTGGATKLFPWDVNFPFLMYSQEWAWIEMGPSIKIHSRLGKNFITVFWHAIWTLQFNALPASLNPIYISLVNLGGRFAEKYSPFYHTWWNCSLFQVRRPSWTWEATCTLGVWTTWTLSCGSRLPSGPERYATALSDACKSSSWTEPQSTSFRYNILLDKQNRPLDAYLDRGRFRVYGPPPP